MINPFQYLNDYYDKIYVLTVEAAGARRELFAKRFEGLSYSFFYGADKSSFIAEDLIANNIYNEQLSKKNHRFSKTMRPGEIACAWSHRLIYEDMLKNNFERILIFEDDAVPDENMIEKIPAIIKEIPEDCELLMWGWAKNGESSWGKEIKKAWYHVQHAAGLLKLNHRVIKNFYATPFSLHLKKAGFHDYTYAYGLTKTSAEKLIYMQQPLQYIADNLLAYACTKEIIKGYITWPQIFLHDNLPDGTARDSYIR
jgi:glycosyl transferase family 25